MASNDRIEDVDGIVRRMGDLHVAGRRMDCGVVKPSVAGVIRQRDIPDMLQHTMLPGTQERSRMWSR
jgi:hypothetical protein